MNPTLGSAPFFHASGPTAFLLGDAEEWGRVHLQVGLLLKSELAEGIPKSVALWPIVFTKFRQVYDGSPMITPSPRIWANCHHHHNIYIIKAYIYIYNSHFGEWTINKHVTSSITIKSYHECHLVVKTIGNLRHFGDDFPLLRWSKRG
jgi:hypothetical protein